jgi:hypothetical protein
VGIPVLALLAAPAYAEGPSTSAAHKTFMDFCTRWMAKLDKRESFNLKRAVPAKNGKGVVLEYKGYSDRAVRCEVEPLANSREAVGKLVYDEFKMQTSGDSKKHALDGRPSEISRQRIMEIFKFNGKEWEY